jgi:aspartate/methionine/tyrosine aminotransferase
MFSRRTPRDLGPNAWARLRAERGAAIRHDLTVSNPTACGIEYPAGLLRGLSQDAALSYRPSARGLESARKAIAGEYVRHGVQVDPGRIVLTASTSEAYAFLFKLLCDPGDAVCLPAPSYPLLEHLATLEGVVARPYRLVPERDWQPEDPGGVEGPVRAWVAVHPNNPTGSFLDTDSARALVAACARDDAALIVDEVFLDYPLENDSGATARPSSFASQDEVLTFTLGGLSKSVGLPQLKLSWIVVSGPEPRVGEALERLEFIADNHLSVATPIQHALPEVLAEGAGVRETILSRCRASLAALRQGLAGRPELSLCEPGGGWSAVLRYPRVVDEERLVLALLERHGVALYPGYFFDFPTDGYLVTTLLTPPPPGIGDILVNCLK